MLCAELENPPHGLLAAFLAVLSVRWRFFFSSPPITDLSSDNSLVAVLSSSPEEVCLLTGGSPPGLSVLIHGLARLSYRKVTVFKPSPVRRNPKDSL